MILKIGLPHSDIHGSKGARPSPQLFAACHVLHRLLAPRHPPDALFNASFHALPMPRKRTRCRISEDREQGSDDPRHQLRLQPSCIVVRAVSCIRPVQNSHEPKAPPNRTFHRIGMQQNARAIPTLSHQNQPRDRRASHNPQRSKRPFLRCRNNNRATASGLDSPRKSSSTMSMNVSVQKTEVREQRSDVLSLLASRFLPKATCRAGPAGGADKTKIREPERRNHFAEGKMVESIGIEPTTSSLQSSRSPN